MATWGKLPNEIIVDISSYLSFSNLACVCKELYSLILENTLRRIVTLQLDLILKKQWKCKIVKRLISKYVISVLEQWDMIQHLYQDFQQYRFLEFQSGDINAQCPKMFDSWNSVEKIVNSGGMDTTTELLQLLTFAGLRSIELCWSREYMEIIERHDLTQEFIRATNNASNLQLKLTDSVVSIADMEDLHERATKLEHLKLIDVGLCHTDDIENQAIYQSKDSLKFFSLQGIEVLSDTTTIGTTVFKSDKVHWNQISSASRVECEWI